MVIKKDFAWIRYQDEGMQFDDKKVGKWMSYFANDFDAIDYVATACKEAVESGVVTAAKHSNLNGIFGPPAGVACFYLHGDDVEGHKKVIAFLLKKNLICKTKGGRYYNISFKYNHQTTDGQYGKDFEGETKLDQFINLSTGEWL